MTTKAKRTNINEELPKWLEIGCVGKQCLFDCKYSENMMSRAMKVLLWQKTAHFMTITPVSTSFPLSKKVFLILENQQKGSIYYGKCLKAP